MSRPFMLLAILLVARPAPAEDRPAETLPSLLAKVRAAYGGEAALRRMAHQSARGTVTSPTRGTATMQRRYDRPTRLQVDVAFPNEKAESRVLTDGHSTRNGEPVEGPPHQAMALQAARLDLPFLLIARAAQVQDVGVLQRDGQPRHVLELALGERVTISAEIEPSTGRILRSVGNFLAPGVGPMEFATDYSGFEQISGVLVARHERNTANGTLTGDSRLESFDFPAK